MSTTDIVEKANVLYVDDEASNLAVFKATFRRDYNVFICTSADEALNILKDNHIHVIITDQRMPGKTGTDFLEEIVHEYPDAIRMILTGFSDNEASIKAINQCRVFKYITKPWDEGELKQTIDIGIRINQIEQTNRQLLEDMKQEVIKQQRILTLFQKYVPENIINESLKKGNGKSLFEGQVCPVSVLFIDIRGFTKFASMHHPKEIVSYLNHFFSIMTKCINRHKGNVNKFIGDCILALFGAPIIDIYSQQNAVLCALNMLHALKKFNEKYEKEFNFQSSVGISVHYGDAVVGNVGSEARIEYTAIGDTINVASRIENLAKEKPNTIIVSEPTYLAVKDLVLAEPLGLHEIRGKEEKMALFKIISKKMS